MHLLTCPLPTIVVKSHNMQNKSLLKPKAQVHRCNIVRTYRPGVAAVSIPYRHACLVQHPAFTLLTLLAYIQSSFMFQNHLGTFFWKNAILVWIVTLTTTFARFCVSEQTKKSIDCQWKQSKMVNMMHMLPKFDRQHSFTTILEGGGAGVGK